MRTLLKWDPVWKFFLITGLFLAGCQIQSTPNTEDHIQNPESKTLSFLLKDEDLPGGWKWSSIVTSQEYQNPTAQNNYSSEIVTRSLDGLYKGEYAIKIYHRIEKYDQKAVAAPTLQYPQDHKRDFFSLEQLESIKNTDYLCSDPAQSSDEFTVCNVVVQYESMNSILLILTPSSLGKGDLEAIISSSISSIDEHVHNK